VSSLCVLTDDRERTARLLGVKPLLRELGRATAAGSGAGQDAQTLTARELEVLEFVAVGRRTGRSPTASTSV
jgi:hypothetical protein